MDRCSDSGQTLIEFISVIALGMIFLLMVLSVQSQQSKASKPYRITTEKWRSYDSNKTQPFTAH